MDVSPAQEEIMKQNSSRGHILTSRDEQRSKGGGQGEQTSEW